MTPFALRRPYVAADLGARRLVRCLLAGTLLAGLAACASGTPTVTDRGAITTGATSASRAGAGAGADAVPQGPDATHPVGVVAIGHSGLTGFQSDLDNPQSDAFANSWATGTNPAVDSIYARLVKALPETAGHVANLARDGVEADLMPFQAQDALKTVPVPKLALVQIMDNDIRCDGTDPAHLPEFRASVREAVSTLVAASPGVTVILVGGAGRPAGYAAAIAALPTTPVGLVGTGSCALFSANRVVNRAEVARLTGIVDAYEAELAKACSGIPQCHTDAGAASRVQDSLDGFGSDLGHQSILGHARTAAAVWPEVAKALGLPAG